MNVPFLIDLSPYAFSALVAHWAVLWLGLYLIGSRPRSAASVLIGLTFVCGAAYLLEVAYFFIPTTPRGVALREQWLAGWVIITPALFLHGFMLLTGFKPPWRRWLLGCAYAFALAVFIGGFFSGVFNEFADVTLDAEGHLHNLPIGRFYWVMALQVIATMLLALAVLVRARFTRPGPVQAVRRQLGLVKSGMVLIFLSVGMLHVNGLLAAPLPDPVFFPVGLAGSLMVAVPLLRYSGRLGGQMLRLDARSSSLTALVMMALFLVAATVAGASVGTVAATGWLVIVQVALGGEMRAFTDRAAYGRAGRLARAGLRTAETFAGTSAQVDLDAIRAEQSGEVVDYLSTLDRVSVASSGRGFVEQDWLRLLARDEFAPVRAALGLPADWRPGERPSRSEVHKRLRAKLLPRERQALGLWYMGYSDKDMARLMGVKANVPRSYLNEGKKKLALSAGPALMLFVHFSGLAGADALPLLGAGASASPDPTIR